jgi:NTE family protein
MNTGLVLSGGGARGIAHIGAIKAFEEYGLEFTHIAGTSSGSIVGALYASGRNWEEILGFFKSVQIFSFTNYAWDKPGLVDAEKFYDRFATYIARDSFAALIKPLFITATDILEGTLKVFSSGELIRPVLASAAFPGLFAPVKIGESYYVDGGVINNFPVDLLTPVCDEIYGVYVNPLEKIGIGDLRHSFNILERAFKIRTAHGSLPKFSDCKLVICPKGLEFFNIFSLRDIDRIFKIGYEAAKKALITADFEKQQ